MRERRPSRTGDWLLACYAVCCVAALTWPVYGWFGNKIEPFVLGLPFSLAWIVGWVVLSFVALVIYNAWDTRRDGVDGES